MEREAAYSLFSEFLQKKGIKDIDLKKELPGLLAFGYAKGCFINPHTVHSLEEWRKFGDKICEAILEEDKVAKKLGKFWKVVNDTLLQHEAEKRAAEQARGMQQHNRDWFSISPTPPAFQSVMLPAQPSAPPPNENTAPPSATPPDPPAPAEPLSNNADPLLEPPAPPPPTLDAVMPVPGASTDPAGAIAKERRDTWAAIAKHCLSEELQGAEGMAFPVIYNQMPGGRLNATITPLDWKLLAQLRSTVSEFGLHGEPVKQMLDYFWATQLLLPSDLRSISRMILTEHQQLLFNAYWQAYVNESVAVIRQPGDPLHGVTADELMGTGPYSRTEAQVHIGADKIREAMDLVRKALNRVKEPGGVPLYMSLKQGRNESFGEYVDKLTAAITKAGVPDYMKGTMLKQCVLQNANSIVKQVINTLGPYWTIEELLDKVLQIPTGENAFLVNAIQDFIKELKEQAQNSQIQVLAALAPLQGKANNSTDGKTRSKCYRCGATGHFRRECRATGIWCQQCQNSTHNTSVCRSRSGNSRQSARNCSGRAQTQVVAAAQITPASNFSPNNPFHGQENSCNLPQPQPQPMLSDCNLPQPVASDWIWPRH
ncbi:endogenous retrovirus group K member 5 Gag polyprotein-like [Pipra filicauda]|uniref:Endogenous retrovirus group K member 5 Gag polyprotein-like n=1 Tax=Pipra filicauda TaxID=649802 RepID=A0A7R5KKG3_9PASS|nr:endogenous retrovirus group K member 5 Gag polyprotein-like [Pipra filicauda]